MKYDKDWIPAFAGMTIPAVDTLWANGLLGREVAYTRGDRECEVIAVCAKSCREVVPARA